MSLNQRFNALESLERIGKLPTGRYFKSLTPELFEDTDEYSTIKQALTQPTKEQAKYITIKHQHFPNQIVCSNCQDNGNFVLIGGWEKYCPICGSKFELEEE